MKNGKSEVLFVLGSRSWDCWIPPFLSDDQFSSSYTYFDADDPRSVEDFTHTLAGINADVVVLMSHHRTLKRDAHLGRLLEKSLTARIVFHPLDLAHLAHDKRAMSKAAARAGNVSIIPELAFEEAIAHLSAGGTVIRKLNDGTEGNNFAVFSHPQDLLNACGSDFPQNEFMLQPFIEGEEYSVVAVAGPWGTQVYEPVFKGANSTLGIHPCKRMRSVPRYPAEEAVTMRLMTIVAELCSLFPHAHGLLEFEFIRNGNEFFFLELNPRLAATTRMVSMASVRNPFCKVAGVGQYQRGEAELVRVCKYAAEIPCRELSPSMHERILRVGKVSVSSRITLAYELHQDLVAGLNEIRTILAEGEEARRATPTVEASLEPIPVLLDQDLNYPSDDYQALLLMHAALRFDIQACTAVAGNTWMEETYRNFKDSLRAIHADHIPVFKGAPYASILGNRSAALRMLEQGLVPFAGAYAKSDSPRMSAEDLQRIHCVNASAPDAICAYSERYRSRLQILATGPLTNIAQSLRRDALLGDKIARIVFMGGHFGADSSLDRPDFNVWFDAQAAAEVFAARLPITVVPLEVCRSARSSPNLYQDVRRVGRQGIASLFSEDFSLLSEQHGLQMTLCDQLAALVTIDDTLIIEAKMGRVTVDTSASELHGRTRFLEDSLGSTRLVIRIDAQRAHTLLLSLVERMNRLTCNKANAGVPKRPLDMIPPFIQDTAVTALRMRQHG